MTLEEAIVAKLQRVPEGKREKVLLLLDEWIKQQSLEETGEVRRAIAIVQSTWATLTLDQETLQWVAEDKELEYDLG
jgi:hypothetical protein